jgi:hypothetical protein
VQRGLEERRDRQRRALRQDRRIRRHPGRAKAAGYLKDEPSTTNGYTISIDAAGVVKAVGACTH